MAECSNCGKSVSASTRFCPECGAKTSERTKFCQDCGDKISEKTKFCQKCGEKNFNPATKERSKKNNTVVIVVTLLIFVIIVVSITYFSQQHSTGGITDIVKEIRSPKLSVENVDGNLHFSLSSGCYGTVQGRVSNQGNANAENVIIECDIQKTTGGIWTSGSTSLGTVYPNSQQSFSLNMDFSCLGLLSPPEGDFNCRAECSNC